MRISVLAALIAPPATSSAVRADPVPLECARRQPVRLFDADAADGKARLAPIIEHRIKKTPDRRAGARCLPRRTPQGAGRTEIIGTNE